MNPIAPTRHRPLLLALAVVAAAGSALLITRGASAPPPAAPSGYQRMTLDDVTPQPAGGYAVRLIDADHVRTVTIYVGPSEGLAISLRSEGQSMPRPLTVDLLDSVMRELGGELDHVQVDALRYNTFYGSLHVRQGQHTRVIDARPSDAIALALGRHVPVLVADTVLATAGRTTDR
jgi:uncharacterized protein